MNGGYQMLSGNSPMLSFSIRWLRQWPEAAALFLILLPVCALSGEPDRDQKKSSGWTPEIMIQYRRLAVTDISPDGKWVAYTVSEPVMEESKSEFLTHIHMAGTDGKNDFQLTRGKKSCFAPRWSPDGRQLAFLSARDADAVNLWLIHPAGGEAEQLTSLAKGINRFQWSPDGGRIAFTMTDPQTEQEDKDKKLGNDAAVVDENFKYSHLYVIPAEKDTDGKRPVRRLTGGEFHVGAFDWSPDGKWILFSHQATPGANDWTTSVLSSVPSDSGEVKPFFTKSASDNPHFSPDGRRVAFTWDGGDTRWARRSDIYIMPSEGGAPKKPAETQDSDAYLQGWSADGRMIFYTETDRTSPRVFAMPADGGKPRVLTPGGGSSGSLSFSRDTKTMSVVYQAPETLPQVFVTPVFSFKPFQITDVNRDFPDMPLGRTEVMKWRSKDGMEIEGLVTYPVHYLPGRKYPLILLIHGGPAGVFTQGYTAASGVYALQAFAQADYVVLRPNPRGSGGYGLEFRRANINDWGFGDFEDDMAGVDLLIEKGIVHPDSLGVTGWSYGGFMTSLIITRTGRFRAAAVGAGVTNLMSFTGTSDIPGFLPDYFPGEFWDNPGAYSRHSAMFNIKGVKTPTLILHGEEDVRVPLSQGKELYNALKRQGCPVKMVIYPRTPHGLQEPRLIRDAGRRLLDWFELQLRGKEGCHGAL